jgi:nicotinamidase-related amidase
VPVTGYRPTVGLWPIVVRGRGFACGGTILDEAQACPEVSGHTRNTVHRGHGAAKAAWSRTFEYGTWGGRIAPGFEPQPRDIVAQEHWCSSGFANTDLDLLLKKHGIHQLIVMGLIAHTCLKATVRYGAELGHEVTVVKDATAGYSDQEMHAALDVNIPNYATAIVTADEVVQAMSSTHD